jgi:WD40 repeat protein
LYDTTTYEVRQELFRDGEVNAVAFSPDGQRLACGGDDALLAVYDLATGATMRWERPGGNLIFTVKFSPDSSLVVAGSRFMMLAVYDAATGARLRTLHFGGSVESSDFSRCGRWLAVGDFTGAVALFDARDRFICRRVLRRGGAVPTVVFSPDSSTLAIGSWDNTVSLYDVETGALCRRRESRRAVDASKKD